MQDDVKKTDSQSIMEPTSRRGSISIGFFTRKNSANSSNADNRRSDSRRQEKEGRDKEETQEGPPSFVTVTLLSAADINRLSQAPTLEV
jgi:hypothetical protein